MENQKTSQNLFNILVSKDFAVKTLDSSGKEQADLAEVEMFSFDFEANDKNFGTVVILLNSKGNMELFYGDNIGKTMDRLEKKIWQDLLYQLRMFAKRNMMGFQLQNINRLKYSMQGMASMNESFENIFEGYYGTKKTSYNPQGNAKIIIKHSKNIGENDKRYRNVKSIFIQNETGERFKLPFKKLVGARAMARHVTEGGNPYDIFGMHIIEMVENIGTLGKFMRRSKMFSEDEDTQGLVETGRTHYDSMRKGLKQISGKRGYHTYRESWTPAEISETDYDVDSIRQLFTEKSLNPNVDNALPLLARLSETMPEIVLDDIQVEDTNMKELDEFAGWADEIVDETVTNKEKADNKEWNKRPEVAGIQDRGGYETSQMGTTKKKKVQEGTWSLPRDEHDIDALAEFFAMEQPAGVDAINATDALYELIGDDTLFDNLGHFAKENPEGDVRGVVIHWITEFISAYPTHASAQLLSANLPKFQQAISNVQEAKDLDSDEQCLNASKDEKLTDKGNGMDAFKDYVKETDTATPVTTKPTQDPNLVKLDEELNLSSLMQLTNHLLQK